MSGYEGILNERTLLVLFGAAAWLATRISAALKKGRQASQASRPARTPEGRTFDPDAETRRRQVREEVARKIAARRGAAPQPVPQPATLAGHSWKLPEKAILREEPPPAPPPPVVMTPLPPRARAIILPQPDAAAPAQTDWLAALREPESARRAMVLREILGPPVSLR